ncbi:MAG: hypothetical protein KIT35_22255 [Piscinibacter sp.]|uniref:hypothetical protein n=1 Tax=Piscinibacter TaxID=1114981 RepID=UPI000FDF1BE4|nr:MULTISPECIES: hypothetical protein [Piscinibacter]MCW5666564.1 hypothetical protein [Piscinibacter sp.]
MQVTEATRTAARWELRFASLFDAGRGYAFPCDADGGIDLAALSDRERASLRQAQHAVGRDLGVPVVVPAARH